MGWELLRACNDRGEQAFLESLFTAHDIKYYIKNDSRHLHPYGGFHLATQIYVDETQLEQANDLLKELDSKE